ncbi:MAG TPA: hypothetical protein PK425_06855 [Syntrophales bacterium]|nr:hypothetical protein [Syntrophales bacterium]HPX56240.1 hypothetical protein [Syntrophales bacterium]HQA83578.1 hypothetical protein [Syntrophales bacterium]
MSEIRMTPGPEEKVYDLVDVVEEDDVMEQTGPLLGKVVYELVDVVKEETSPMASSAVPDDEVMKRVTAVAENVCRELFPAIAERVIREEIAKLKSEHGSEESR